MDARLRGHHKILLADEVRLPLVGC